MTTPPKLDAVLAELAETKRLLSQEQGKSWALESELKQLKNEICSKELEAVKDHEAVEARYQARLADLAKEKERMANAIEKEEEYMVNKLSKQLDTLKTERRSLHDEKLQLGRQVTELTSHVAKLCREKVQLESQLEMEEESITNRLQRQLDHLMIQYRKMEGRLEACGIRHADVSDYSEDEASVRSVSASPMNTYLLSHYPSVNPLNPPLSPRFHRPSPSLPLRVSNPGSHHGRSHAIPTPQNSSLVSTPSGAAAVSSAAAAALHRQSVDSTVSSERESMNSTTTRTSSPREEFRELRLGGKGGGA